MTIAHARLGAVIAAIVSWLAFAALTVAVKGHPLPFAVDEAVGRALYDLADRNPILADVGRALDVVGGYLVALIVVLVVFVLLVRSSRPLVATFLVASAVGGVVLSDLVKGWIERPRPSTVGHLLAESTWSYPSGHATSGITTWVALGLVALIALRRPARWWVAVPLFILGPVIGLSRVFLGVHWPTDVLGGWLLGLAWLTTVAALTLTIAHRRAASTG